MNERRPTLEDVARVAGVSRATVSFVLNQSPGQTISPTTSARVRTAARELGYVPHAIARALREGTSRLILLELTGLSEGEALRSFVQGMRQELALNGHALLLHAAEVGDDESGLIETVRPRAVVTPGANDRPGTEATDGGWTDGLAAHSRVQIEHLATTGHRVIAVAVPEPAHRIAHLRLRFATESAEQLHLDQPAVLRLPADRAGTCEAIRSLRTTHPDVTAIAAFDDEVAVRALAAITDLGLTSPDDLAVIGFDDAGRGEFTVPPLTSVRIDADAFGRRAARQALCLDVADLTPDAAVVVRRATA
jgi:DNA-binding LacI/PurR family transcriptional regulator